MPIFRNIIEKFQREERGSALVYGAIALIGVVALSALAIDGGNAYLKSRNMQNTADAVALTGAHVLAYGGTESQALSEAESVAALNEGTIEVFNVEDGKIVRVTVDLDVSTYFARAMNINAVPVSASAAATFKPIPNLDEAPPLCFDMSCITGGETVEINADETNTYCADSFQHYAGGATSGLFIHSPELENPLAIDAPYSYAGDFREFARVGSTGIYEEYEDGTARIVMQVANEYNRGFEMDIQLTGRTHSLPA